MWLLAPQIVVLAIGFLQKLILVLRIFERLELEAAQLTPGPGDLQCPLADFQVEAIVYNGGHRFPTGAPGREELLPYKLITFNQK